MSRIRSLVDAAYACDTRIARFKEEEKQKKLDAKKAKQDAIRARQEEEERVSYTYLHWCTLSPDVILENQVVEISVNSPFHFISYTVGPTVELESECPYQSRH